MRYRSNQPNLFGRKLKQPYEMPGQIARVVPGQLGYVDVENVGTFSFKPNQLRIRKRDGSLQAYRGEPFDEIGLQEGRNVSVKRVHVAGSKGEAVVVTIDQPAFPTKGSHFSKRLRRLWAKS